MFHRPRPDIQMPTQNSADSDVSASPVLSVSPVADPVLDSSSLPLSQPEPVKEPEPMSTNTPNASSNDVTASEGSAAPVPQVPGSSSYIARPASVRSPYMPYNPYGAPSASTPESTQTVSTGRKLVIGEGITMSGEIEACDHLIVEGTVEATLKGASILDVSQSGMFYGAVEIAEATIAGRFEGELTVAGRLTIRSTGSVIGSISYKELAVEAGAMIDGKINPLREGAKAVATEKKPLAPRAVKVEGAESANSELPFVQKAVAVAG